MKKSLVVYYSFEGHTKHIADVIAKELNADILRIKPVEELKSKGFGKYFWGGAQVYMKKIPTLEPFDIDFDSYDSIFLGSPIWALTITPPIKSFLMGEYLKDKDVYFFYTHDGGPGKVESIVRKSIEKENRLISTQSIINKKSGIEEIDQQVISWIHSFKL